MTTVTIARFHLRLVAWFCLVAGLQVGLAGAALDTGRTALWSGLGAAAALVAAYFTYRDGIARAAAPNLPRVQPPAT